MRGSVQDSRLYDLLPEPTDDENDMLDLAYGLTETCASWRRLPRLLHLQDMARVQLRPRCWLCAGGGVCVYDCLGQKGALQGRRAGVAPWGLRVQVAAGVPGHCSQRAGRHPCAHTWRHTQLCRGWPRSQAALGARDGRGRLFVTLLSGTLLVGCAASLETRALILASLLQSYW